ncbi:MAG: hemolysin family protein [Rectinema sp.]
MSGILDLFRHRKEDGVESDIGNEERKEMIRGVEELSETTVKAVMVPRTDTVFLSLDALPEEILAAVVESGHSRIPVYRETMDDVVGVLYAKDLLGALVRKTAVAVGDIMRKPYFVPETKRIDALLREFKRRRVHIAVVVDEYGGVSGIVCMEDIIEEIVGEIQDEFDNEPEDIVKLGPDAWLCDSRARLEDLNESLGLSLPSGDFESLGGYVFDLFGRIPARQEKIEAEDLLFTVQEMEGHRIISVKVERKKDGADETRGDVGEARKNAAGQSGAADTESAPAKTGADGEAGTASGPANGTASAPSGAADTGA